MNTAELQLAVQFLHQKKERKRNEVSFVINTLREFLFRQILEAENITKAEGSVSSWEAGLSTS